jgi:predicted DsbA family dithiol-disulfide isomerase
MGTHEVAHLVIYGDFNCPFSALASARATDLEARGLAEIEWRAVEHDPGIPVAGEPVTLERRGEFERELAQIRSLLVDGEIDRLRVPDDRANTGLATAAYAATPKHAQSKVREQLFESYWTRGDDLDAELIARLVGNRRDEQTAVAWRTAWLALPGPIVPTMVLPDGYVSRGLGALNRLRSFGDDRRP